MHDPTAPFPSRADIDPRLEPYRRRMNALKRRGRERSLRVVAGGSEPWVEVDGRRLLNLSGGWL